MHVRLAPCLGCIAWALLVACSSPYSLDRMSEDPFPGLTETERTGIASQVEAAIKEESWTRAWNQAVEAAMDRATFERIALAALEKEAGVAEDFFQALRDKYGAMSPSLQAGVDELAEAAEGRKDWKRAAEIRILTAADGDYAEAWAIYRRTPVWDSADVLELIREAREAREAREDDEAAKNEAGD